MITSLGASSPALSHTYVSPADIAEMLPGVTVQMLAMWRHRNTGPAYRKLGSKVLYALDEVEAWVEASAHGGEFGE